MLSQFISAFRLFFIFAHEAMAHEYLKYTCVYSYFNDNYFDNTCLKQTVIYIHVYMYRGCVSVFVPYLTSEWSEGIGVFPTTVVLVTN